MPTFTISSVSYHGFTINGEVELDVNYQQTGRFSKKDLKEIVILLVNGNPSRPRQLQDIRLTHKNTRIEINVPKRWIKAFVKVRG